MVDGRSSILGPPRSSTLAPLGRIGGFPPRRGSPMSAQAIGLGCLLAHAPAQPQRGGPNLVSPRWGSHADGDFRVPGRWPGLASSRPFGPEGSGGEGWSPPRLLESPNISESMAASSMALPAGIFHKLSAKVADPGGKPQSETLLSRPGADVVGSPGDQRVDRPGASGCVLAEPVRFVSGATDATL